ncbi:MAG: hypothetical protein KDI19_04970 [Pseudomonadales bacterium]|nr:hypothetical protein [Pseudomonadales bacterium]
MTRITIATCLLVFSIGAVAQDTPPPPCTGADYRAFDFWLGAWYVYDDAGEFQGTNRVEPLMGKCGLQENWEGAGGNQGTSFNYYSRGSKSWHQTWVDSGGGSLLLEGGLVGKSMQLSGTRNGRDGKPIMDRITWTPLDDGRVRQYWEVSRDSGDTWAPVFDGYYQHDKMPEKMHQKMKDE